MARASAFSRTSRRKCLTPEADRCNGVSVRKPCFSMDHNDAPPQLTAPQQRVCARIQKLPIAQIEMGACTLKGKRPGRSLTYHRSHYWKQRLSAAAQRPPQHVPPARPPQHVHAPAQRKWLQPIRPQRHFGGPLALRKQDALAQRYGER